MANSQLEIGSAFGMREVELHAFYAETGFQDFGREKVGSGNDNRP
jgi:hypothetical protein